MRSSLLLSVLLLLCVGCAAPYRLVRTTDGGPLASATPVTVLPVRYRGVKVDGLDETQYVAQHDDAVGWAEKKQRWGDRLRGELLARVTSRPMQAADDVGSGLVLEIDVVAIERGFETPAMLRPSRTRAVARVRMAGSDEVLYQAESETSHGGTGDRVGDDHAVLGMYFARFLDEQLAPAVPAKTSEVTASRP